MWATEFTRWYLALFFLGVAGFYTLRIIALHRRMGTSPVWMGRPGSLHFATHLAFRLFRVTIMLVCLARLIWPELDRFLVPFAGLWQPAVLLFGDALLLAGFAGALVVHFHMGGNWRSGTRAGDQTTLVTTGPFRRSRNPMTLAVIAAQVGFFLALPSLFSLVCLVVGVWAVTAQVRVEERLLADRFGASYDAYRETTRRWL